LKSSHSRNKKEDHRTGERKLDHRIHLDKVTRRTLMEMILLTNLLKRPPEIVTYATTKSQKVK